MSVVVSANYRDRAQKNWLIRQANATLENYELRESVVLKNFRFCESSGGEAGFGCNIVAVGELAELEVDRSRLVQLQFNGLRFVEKKSLETVQHGSFLVLDESGMYYLPA